MIPETLTRLALLFFFVGIVSLAHWLVMFLFCICGGFKVQDVKLFAGKTIFTCSIANIPVSVGWIPSGASVQTDPDQARTRPFYLRLLMPTVGVGAILALAVCVLGFHAANSAFWATYVQLIRGVVAPLAYGREHINSFLIVAQNSPVYGFGIVAAKCGAILLLPMMGTPGGVVIFELLRRKTEGRLSNTFIGVASLLYVSLYTPWGIAFFAYIWKYSAH